MGLLPFCAKPEGLRPPWWDWGMDEAKVESKSEVEAVVVAPVVPVVEEIEEIEEIEIAPQKPPKILPRW